MSLTERLRILAGRWEDWATILGAEAAAAVRECANDLRGELPKPRRKRTPASAVDSVEST